MKPSHVRSRILQEHDSLRRQLGKLAAAVDDMLVDHTNVAGVQTLARNLLTTLHMHTELEDTILGPALLELDAWGPVRVNRLLLHHEEQRAQAHTLLDTFAHATNPLHIAHLADALVKDLRADMEHEEREILSADLLRDDPITDGAACS